MWSEIQQTLSEKEFNEVYDIIMGHLNDASIAIYAEIMDESHLNEPEYVPADDDDGG